MQKISTENIEKIIDAVREHPSLYDKRNKQYKKTDFNDTVWKKIAQDLQLDEKICRVAWRSLRDQFIKSLKENKGSTGMAIDANKKKYKYFEHLLFLQKSVEPKKTPNNFDMLIEDNSFEESHLEVEDGILFDSQDQDSFTFSPPPPPNKPSSSCSKKTSNDEELKNFLQKLLSQMKDDENKIDKYFQVLAATVKKCDLSVSELTSLQCNLMMYLHSELRNMRKNVN